MCVYNYRPWRDDGSDSASTFTLPGPHLTIPRIESDSLRIPFPWTLAPASPLAVGGRFWLACLTLHSVSPELPPGNLENRAAELPPWEEVDFWNFGFDQARSPASASVRSIGWNPSGWCLLLAAGCQGLGGMEILGIRRAS